MSHTASRCFPARAGPIANGKEEVAEGLPLPSFSAFSDRCALSQSLLCCSEGFSGVKKPVERRFLRFLVQRECSQEKREGEEACKAVAAGLLLLPFRYRQ